MIDWLKEKIVGAFAPKYVGALVRTVVAAIGGALYGLHTVTGQPALEPSLIAKFLVVLEQLLNGLALVGGALLWSFFHKQRNSD